MKRILLLLLIPALAFGQLYRPGSRSVGGIMSGSGLVRAANNLLPFTDSMSTDGALGPRWTAPATWVVSGGTVTCTPTLGPELITNGNMDTSTGWTVGPFTVSAGVATASGSNGGLRQAVAVAGGWYRALFDLKTRTAGTVGCVVGTYSLYSSTATDGILTSGICDGVNIQWYSQSFAGTIDNASAKRITKQSAIAIVNAGVSDVDASVGVVLPAAPNNMVAGLIVSYTDTSNMVVATIDRSSKAKLSKYVAGTFTEVITGTVTYSEGAVIRVTKSGNNYSLYYNGSAVGSTTAITDAAIVNNTRVGVFSTYVGNQLDLFSVKQFP